jgi:hypothetical protein
LIQRKPSQGFLWIQQELDRFSGKLRDGRKSLDLQG